MRWWPSEVLGRGLMVTDPNEMREEASIQGVDCAQGIFVSGRTQVPSQYVGCRGTTTLVH